MSNRFSLPRYEITGLFVWRSSAPIFSLFVFFGLAFIPWVAALSYVVFLFVRRNTKTHKRQREYVERGYTYVHWDLQWSQREVCFGVSVLLGLLGLALGVTLGILVARA